MAKRILAVEDDPDILFIVEQILNEEGYEVYTSEDGKDITNHVNHVKPDLILLDIRLPAGDGRQLCKDIRNTNVSVPIILMSAHINYSEGFSNVCANDFIAKPFDITELLERIEKQLVA